MRARTDPIGWPQRGASTGCRGCRRVSCEVWSVGAEGQAYDVARGADGPELLGVFTLDLDAVADEAIGVVVLRQLAIAGIDLVEARSGVEPATRTLHFDRIGATERWVIATSIGPFVARS